MPRRQCNGMGRESVREFGRKMGVGERIEKKIKKTGGKGKVYNEQCNLFLATFRCTLKRSGCSHFCHRQYKTSTKIAKGTWEGCSKKFPPVFLSLAREFIPPGFLSFGRLWDAAALVHLLARLWQLLAFSILSSWLVPLRHAMALCGWIGS